MLFKSAKYVCSFYILNMGNTMLGFMHVGIFPVCQTASLS